MTPAGKSAPCSSPKAMSGQAPDGTVIYGYLWDEKREHWLVDEEAAAVVRHIFALAMEGYGPYQIATKLSEEKIEMPAVTLPAMAKE